MFTLRTTLSAASLLIVLDGYAGAVQPSSITKDDQICKIQGGQAALFDNRIYVVGAALTLIGSDSPADTLLSIDLGQERPLNGYLSNVESIALPNGFAASDRSNYVGGAMWFDDSNLYTLATLDTDNSAQLWEYSRGGQWKESNIPTTSMPRGNGKNAAYVSNPRFNMSFYSGGARGDSELGLISLDSSNPDDLKLSREDMSTDNTGTTRSEAPIFYLPYGNQGVLVYFGGLPADSTKPGLAMNQFDIYDIESGTWNVVQTDVGTTSPGSRKNFCGWVTEAQDSSSHFITIFGGTKVDGISDEISTEIWVLAIPSFIWTQITNTDGEGRSGHSCFTHNHNSGIVLGGDAVSPDAKCLSPLKLLDLSSYTWKDTLDPADDSKFIINGTVAKNIGATEQGDVQQRKPKAGWPNTKLESLFSATVSPKPTSTPPAATSNGSSATPTETQIGKPSGDPIYSPYPDPTSRPNQHRSLSTGQKAAIGGAVGGLAIMLLTLVSACFFIRKRKDGRPDRYIYHSKSSSLTICDNEQEKDGFLAVPTGDYGGGYRDAVPAPMLKSGHSRIESWSRQVPAHRNSCSVSSISKLDVPGHRSSSSVSSVSKLDNKEDFYRNVNKVPGGLAATTRGPMSDTSSAMGTIIVCDGESPGMNGQRPQRLDAAPLARQTGTVREISPFRQPVRDTSPYRPEDVGKTFI